MLPAISDIVELPIVAIQREARELAEMRQVAAVPLVFQHIEQCLKPVDLPGRA